MSPAPWAAHLAPRGTPFGKSIAARDLFPARPTPRRSPGSASASWNRPWGSSRETSGRARQSRCAPPSPALDPTRHQVIDIANPAFGTRGLYVTIVRALGARPRYLKAELMAQAGDLLAAETAERHRRVVPICDEAHLLSQTSSRSSGSSPTPRWTPPPRSPGSWPASPP